MATKKNELLDEIEQLQAENTRLAADVRAHEARESERQRREHRAKQEKLRTAEAKERRDRIDDLAAGKLSLHGATQWAIVHEEGSRPGIEVFVPLDEEEQRVALGFLRRKDVSETTVSDLLARYFDLSSLLDGVRRSTSSRPFVSHAMGI